MTDIWGSLARAYEEHLPSIPRPVATVPLGPVTEPRKLPDNRTDFERDDAATGV